MGFHGNINYFVLLNDFEKSKYYFQYKFLFYDNHNDDIKILYYFIKNSKNIKNDRIYNLYLLKINEKFNQNINFDDENDDKYLENIVLFYKYYTKLFNDENIKKININDDNEIKFIEKYYNIEDKLINDINNYNNFKKILFLKIENEKIDTFIKNINSNLIKGYDIITQELFSADNG
jgi:hypothetical protein